MDNSERIKRIPHTSKETGDLVRSLGNMDLDSSYYLLVLAGKNRGGKRSLIRDLKHQTETLREVDLRDVISTVEAETYENIDILFNSLSNSDTIVYLKNGDVLSGEYTGNTYSARRYATPQEKYLLKKIENSGRVFILDLLDEANVHNMLKRKAHTVIEFNAPDSGLGKLFWKLKQIRVHGHTFENKRPLKK